MHKKGICHRDLKLDNVLINPRNISEIKIIDFGTASQFLKVHKRLRIKKLMWTKTGTM